MALLLNAKDIKVVFPAKEVLSGVTLGINEGDRIGIVGKNGDGKSTLLKVLAGLYTPDEGEVTYRGSLAIGVLSQEEHLDDTQSIESAVVGDVPEYTWAANRQTREIIEALVADLPWQAPVGTLSGGQRRRVVLAQLLIKDWDILMLDEPTNHLDIKTIAWLAEHLQTRWTKSAGALLCVTHDRWFLDEVAESMWEVHDGQLDAFEGGFSAYVQQRVERQRVADKSEEKRRNIMRKELAWLARGARARSTKPKFHLKAAYELIEYDPPVRNVLELKKASMSRLGKQVFELTKVSKEYEDHTVLKPTNWIIGPGDRIGILGQNGSGKSTLIGLLTGAIAPTSGVIKVGQTVKMACLSQRLDELAGLENDRVREVLKNHQLQVVVDGKSVSSAQLLERLGFATEHLQSYVKDLSGGEKRRLQLLLTLVDEPNVLLLDEPGNDMDIDMLTVMEDLLDSWPGTLILVSHDRHLLERVTDDQFALLDGEITHVPRGVDEYLALLDKKDAARTSVSGAAGATGAMGAGAAARSTSVASKALHNKRTGGELNDLRRELRGQERKIKSLEKKAEDIALAMHQGDPSDYTALGELEQELRATKNLITETEEAWLELSAQVDEG